MNTCTTSGIQAILNYTLPSPTGEELWSYLVRPPPPKPWTNAINDTRSVFIHNARGREDEFSLDRSGFEFMTYPSAVPDLFDELSVRTIYYQEIVQMLKQCTGAKEIVIAGHMYRRSHGDVAQSDTKFRDITGPAFAVHGDRTLDAGRSLSTGGLARFNGRHRIINVWRPIGEPVRDVPLAVMDYRTIDVDDDLVPIVVRYNQDIETLGAFYRETHKWYYLEKQTSHEVILMKNYDSVTDGVARVALHSAFHDPTCAPNVPPRRSIEVRAFLFD